MAMNSPMTLSRPADICSHSTGGQRTEGNMSAVGDTTENPHKGWELSLLATPYSRVHTKEKETDSKEKRSVLSSLFSEP